MDPAPAVGQADANENREEASTAETPVPAGDEGVPGWLGELTGRLGKLEEQLAGFHRREAHRESIIDRLHGENQRLQGGIGRTVLGPVVTDLIRLHDQLRSQARQLDAAGRDGTLLWSFADDVEQILDGCGLEVFSAEPGDPFEGGRHRPVGVVACADESRDNTVAEVVAVGFRERDTDRIRRPVRAYFHRYSPGGEAGQPDATQSQ